MTRTIREDPGRRGLLYAGTETGIYVSLDDGASWRSLQCNLPVAPIHDLIVKDNDLVVATHGRAFWILDDLSPLRQFREGALSGPAHLFRPRTAVRLKTYGQGNRPPSLGKKNFRRIGPLVAAFYPTKQPTGEVIEEWLDAGKNPPIGVIVWYVLNGTPEGPLTLEFLDERGQLMQAFTSDAPAAGRGGGAPADQGEGEEGLEEAEEVDEARQHPTAQAGLNRFVWNMRCADAIKVPGDSATETAIAGPVAAPGWYRVRLRVAAKTYEESVEIVKDPRVRASREDLDAQFELLLQIRDKLSETHRAINALRALRGQVDAWIGRSRRDEQARAVTQAARDLHRALSAIEAELLQVEAKSPLGPAAKLNAKLATLAAFVDSADAAPTKQAQEVFDDLSARIDAHLRRLEQITGAEAARFNELVRTSGVNALGVSPNLPAMPS